MGDSVCLSGAITNACTWRELTVTFWVQRRESHIPQVSFSLLSYLLFFKIVCDPNTRRYENDSNCEIKKKNICKLSKLMSILLESLLCILHPCLLSSHKSTFLSNPLFFLAVAGFLSSVSLGNFLVLLSFHAFINCFQWVYLLQRFSFFFFWQTCLQNPQQPVIWKTLSQMSQCYHRVYLHGENYFKGAIPLHWCYYVNKCFHIGTIFPES